MKFSLTFATVKEATEGNEIVPFFILLMIKQTEILTIESMVRDLLTSDPEYFLIEVRIKPTNNVKVFIDGDKGITIEKCVQINRIIYKQLEAAGIFPNGDFSLEVSSPGLDQPLKNYRQYLKNIGRQVELLLLDGTKKTGNLVEVTEDGIVLEETIGKNRKKEIIRHAILFNNIKTTTIQVKF